MWIAITSVAALLLGCILINGIPKADGFSFSGSSVESDEELMNQRALRTDKIMNGL